MQYRVCHVQEIPRGEKRNYTVKNVQVVVVHSQQGEFYAIYGLCPHQRGPLGAGVLGGLTKAAQAGESLYSPSYSFSFACFAILAGCLPR